MKRYKKEANGKLEVGQVMYTKRSVLTVDRALCKGCELCKLVCPREAISLIPAEPQNGKVVAPRVDIDESKCDFHGICAVVCPFAAIRISINGDETLPAVAKEVFPLLTRDIRCDESRCPADCRDCETACPLHIIEADEGVKIQKELCAGCLVCETECPKDAIRLTKFIEGSIAITLEHCPEGCRACLDVCPVNALGSGEDGRVFAKNVHCIFCGACKLVCPGEDALKIERTAIRHTPVNSGAWNRGLEKLTSTGALIRELAADGVDRARDAVHNLLTEEDAE
ncbi:MAG: 4Fe-4S binding protein [Clostridiales bacterium]|nr:4Fe-4S binding protein [Clostridiales bacterium]